MNRSSEDFILAARARDKPEESKLHELKLFLHIARFLLSRGGGAGCPLLSYSSRKLCLWSLVEALLTFDVGTLDLYVSLCRHFWTPFKTQVVLIQKSLWLHLVPTLATHCLGISLGWWDLKLVKWTIMRIKNKCTCTLSNDQWLLFRMSIIVSSRWQVVLIRTMIIRITETIYEGESLFTIEKVKTLSFSRIFLSRIKQFYKNNEAQIWLKS